MSQEAKSTGQASVQEIWDKTITLFQRRTGQRLDGVSRTPDDLRKALDTHYAAQADADNVSEAKAMGFKIIHCIQLLGGIAAEGASMVFGPAGLCFNALSFLLDIPKKVHEFHGEIDAIFAEVGPALAQFRIYQRMEENTHVDEALRTSIEQVMTSFVDICANCINIHHEGRWKSFKRSAKRILLDEGSVRDELDNFKRLTQDQLNVQATLTLEVALETHQGVAFIKSSVTEIDKATKGIKTDVSGLVEAEQKRGLNDTRKKHLEAIREKLGQKVEEVAKVIDARDDMWRRSLKDSGKWLNEIDHYKQWLDRSSSADPLLVLTGEPGTGKSFLVSAIAQDIQASNSATKAERSLLGYYSFSTTSKTDSDRNRPETAIRSICLQMAEQDAVYARHVAGVCGEAEKDKSFFKDATCEQLWRTLGIGTPARNATHYVLLDSIGVLSAEELARVLDLASHCTVLDRGKPTAARILLSAESSCFDPDWLDSAPGQCLEITQHNAEDIRAFISEQLKNANLFQGQDGDSWRLQDSVTERMVVRSRNCYTTVHHDLGQINAIVASSGTEEELNRLLEEASTDPRALVRSDIETLEAVLNPREIEEVNELLMWIVVAARGLFVHELDAALYLRFKAVSLQPLTQKIDGKYSKLFTRPYGFEVELRDHVEECVVAERVRPRQSVDDPKISATITITNGDIKAVQRFFWDLTHHSSFANGFQFVPGSAYSERSKKKIQLYKIDAHFEVVKMAFEYFLLPKGDERDRAYHVGNYLMIHLPLHLGALYEARGLDELPIADKQYIGSHLYDMFNEGDLIERNWEICDWAQWYASEAEMAIFWKWLDDPVAIARLGARDKKWLRDIKRDENPNQSLLTPIMTMVARNWLQRDDWGVQRPYDWIKGFLALGVKSASESGDDEVKIDNMEQQVENPEEHGEACVYAGESPSNEPITPEMWAMDALGVSEVDDTWCTRLAETYSNLQQPMVAIRHYEQAAGILKAQEPIHRERLAEVYQALGDLSKYDEPYDHELAATYYRQAYEQDDLNSDILYIVATGYALAGNTEEAGSLLPNTLAKKAPGLEYPLFLAILEKAVLSQSQTELTALLTSIRPLLTSSPEYWLALKAEFQTVIDRSSTEKAFIDLAMFHYLLGTAMYHLRREFPEDVIGAAEHWRATLAAAAESDHTAYGWPLDYIKESALSSLEKLCIDQTLRDEDFDLEPHITELRTAYDADPSDGTVQASLASLYTLSGQRAEAREILRPSMVTALNLLIDDDMNNDWEAFDSLRRLLIHSGDYDNARRACMLVVPGRFDKGVLRKLLEDEDPPLEVACAELLECWEEPDAEEGAIRQGRLSPYRQRSFFSELRFEGGRRLADAEPESSEATVWARVLDILQGWDRLRLEGDNCHGCRDRQEVCQGFNSCKYCYDMQLCDPCLDALKADTPGKNHFCSRWHDWISLGSWDDTVLVRAWKRLVPVVAEDGTERLISTEKWLGRVCDEWGLAKEDWGF
ncbi:hypothetical protein BJY00DRAFT_275014, partial [Aspergillus carlsbadensis]